MRQAPVRSLARFRDRATCSCSRWPEAAEGGAGGGKMFRIGRRREVLEVTRAMAALLPVGMPLAQALNAASGVATGDVRDALQAVRERVERGETLSGRSG